MVLKRQHRGEGSLGQLTGWGEASEGERKKIATVRLLLRRRPAEAVHGGAARSFSSYSIHSFFHSFVCLFPPFYFWALVPAGNRLYLPCSIAPAPALSCARRDNRHGRTPLVGDAVAQRARVPGAAAGFRAERGLKQQ